VNIKSEKPMKNRLLSTLAALGALLLVACGSGGVPLSNFPNLTATEGDAPLTLTAPTSKSPAAFNYTSSNPQVATIAGNVVTFVKPGTSTITASQPELGSYNPTSTTALLTVNARTCTAPQVNQAGTCVTPPTCTAPAALTNNVCVAPATAGTFVTRGALSFMPVTRIDTWTNANAFCSTSTINGATGWRLPMQAELSELAASGALAGQGWTLGATWTSSTSTSGAHNTVNLATGAVAANEVDSNGAYVSCVR
jgi:hypothetical protein